MALSKFHGGMLAALTAASSQLVAEEEEEEELQSSPFPQLYSLWHYECVVSPRSPAFHLRSNPASPRSPAFRAAEYPTSTLASYDHHPSLPPLAASKLGDHMQRSSPPLSPRFCEAAAAGSSSAASPSPISRFALAQQALAKRVFNTFDENGDGRVSTEEIGRMFEKLGLSKGEDEDSLTVALMADMPNFSTKTELGYVDEEGFMLLYEMACRSVQAHDDEGAAAADGSSSWGADASTEEGAEQEDLRAAFHVFDKDGNGYISPAELQSVLCSLGFDEQAHQLVACEDMIARVDENGDGCVDFFEFKKLFHVNNLFNNLFNTAIRSF